MCSICVLLGVRQYVYVCAGDAKTSLLECRLPEGQEPC